MTRWRREPNYKAHGITGTRPGEQQTAPSSSTEHRVIDALTHEIAALSHSMREDLQAADRGIAAAGALIVAGLGVALLQKATIVLVALPYGLGIVFFFTLQKYAERLSSAGIRRYLEDILQKLSHGTSPIMQQIVADYWHKRRVDEKAAYVLYGLVMSASAFASVYVANHQTRLSPAVPLAHWMSAKHQLTTSAARFTGLAYIDIIMLMVMMVALYFPYQAMSHAKSIARARAESQGPNVA